MPRGHFGMFCVNKSDMYTKCAEAALHCTPCYSSSIQDSSPRVCTLLDPSALIARSQVPTVIFHPNFKL